MRVDSLYGDGSAVPNKRKSSVSAQQTRRAKTASDALARAGQEPTMRRRMASDLSSQTQKQEQVQLKKAETQNGKKKTAMQSIVDILLGGSPAPAQTAGTLVSSSAPLTPKEQQEQVDRTAQFGQESEARTDSPSDRMSYVVGLLTNPLTKSDSDAEPPATVRKKLPPGLDNGTNPAYPKSGTKADAVALPNPGAPGSDTAAEIKDYLAKSANQVLLGNYTDDVTLLGTLGQLASGFFNIDLPGDVRDLAYDLTHWDTTSKWQTLLDAVGLLPVVGDLKYVGDAGKLAEKALKNADEIGTLVKDADKAADAVDEAGTLVKDADKAGELEKAYQDTAGDVEKAAGDVTEGAGNKGVNYSRPSGYRKGVRDKVWENAIEDDGEVRDPLTQEIINKNDPWQMGHKPGYEFRKHQQSAMKRGISREEFLDEHNNPYHYRPELPGSNQSHKGEDMTEQYFGP
jgi:hypothetical protein